MGFGLCWILKTLKIDVLENFEYPSRKKNFYLLMKDSLVVRCCVCNLLPLSGNTILQLLLHFSDKNYVNKLMKNSQKWREKILKTLTMFRAVNAG